MGIIVPDPIGGDVDPSARADVLDGAEFIGGEVAGKQAAGKGDVIRVDVVRLDVYHPADLFIG